MTLNVEYDIKEIFEKLDSKFDKLESKFDRLETKVDRIGEDVGQLKTDVKVLDGKVEGINKRIDSQEFLNRGVAIGLLVALIGGLVKLFGFEPPH